MKNAKLTIRLPAGELDFAKAYAREHDMTLTALVHRFFSQLRRSQDTDIPRSLEAITGLIPPDVDTRDEYVTHLQRKHR